MTSSTIIGLGTIGSAAVPIIARMPGLSGITLIDADTYSQTNVSNQAINISAVGRSKVEVQAAVIRAINPDIRVHALQERVENVPLASMDSSVILSCVDNRKARQTINRMAWRCGRPWVDAAVDLSSVVRVNTYKPQPGAPCFECSMDDRSYALLEQEYSCDGRKLPVPATATPIELGSIAASLQAGEGRRLLTGDDASLVGAQFMLDTTSHAGHLCRFSLNDQCRFDHLTWDVEELVLPPENSTLADLFDAVDGGPGWTIGLEGHSFATRIDCIACDASKDVVLHLYSRLSKSDRTCHCGSRMFAPGFFSFESIRRSDISAAHLDLRLSDLGLCVRDVISVSGDADVTRHFEITERTIK